MSKLRGRKPGQIEKRLKLLLYGVAGVGKTTAGVQFPNSYIIDAEKGAENYDALLSASNSVLFQTNEIDDVIREAKTLLVEKHEFRSLIIDPVTTLFADLVDRMEQKHGSDFGRHYGEAGKVMKRLISLLMKLDMTVVITAHSKPMYADNFVKIGDTFDGWRRLDYAFDLVLELQRRGKQRVALVKKSRLEAFPDGETFEFSYDVIRERYGEIMERRSTPIELASPEQVEELSHLLQNIKLPDGTAEHWLSKARVESFEEMPQDAIAKCVDFCKSKLVSV